MYIPCIYQTPSESQRVIGGRTNCGIYLALHVPNLNSNHNIVLVGTAGIILQAPTLYDTRPAIDEELSEIEITQIKPDIPIDYPTAEIDSLI